jgi:hypothetical protein
MNYLPELASNHDPPDFCLLSSEDYRWEALMAIFILLFFLFLVGKCSFPTARGRPTDLGLKPCFSYVWWYTSIIPTLG